jgi:hypothetical protein
MSKRVTFVVSIMAVMLVLGVYGANLARISSTSIWFLWLQAAFFVALCLYVAAIAIALIAARGKRRLLLPGLLFGLIGLAGTSAVARFVISKQDERFIRNLARYQQVVEWIEQHNGAKPAQDQFANLTSDIFVQKSPIFGFEVFFVAYPGPFGTRLHGYAYTTADKWNDHFVKVYGTPKRLTNNWFRI